MSKTNRNLLIAVAVLLLASVLTYRYSVDRADRFQRGQLFLSNLNPDEVSGIEIRQGDESVTLQRQADQFTVAERQSYPASNSSVNRLLRDLLAIGLEREVGSGEELAQELEIEPMGEDSLEVVLQDGAGKDMVRMRVGRQFEEGVGHYVQRQDEEGAPIYLTSTGVSLSTDSGSYLDKEIVDHAGSEILRIEGVDFLLERSEQEGGLVLVDADSELDTSKVSGLQSLLSRLQYEEVFVADDPEVDDLAFDPMLRIDLTDGSGYVLSFASQEDRGFLRIQGYNTLQQVEIAMDEAEEELQEKAEKLSRADEVDDFNRFHGSWVYEIGASAADKLRLRKVDLTTS